MGTLLSLSRFVGQKRTVAHSTVHGIFQLLGTPTKLSLFNYLKICNLQLKQAANFGLSQSKDSRSGTVAMKGVSFAPETDRTIANSRWVKRQRAAAKPC